MNITLLSSAAQYELRLILCSISSRERYQNMLIFSDKNGSARQKLSKTDGYFSRKKDPI